MKIEVAGRVDVYHHNVADGAPDLAVMFKQLEDRIVKEIDDRIAMLDKAADDAIARFSAEIAQLRDQVAGGAPTPEVLAAFDRIKAKWDAAGVDTTPPVPTPAPETPAPTTT